VNTRHTLMLGLTFSLLGGCATVMGPLDYKAEKPYVPVTLAINEGSKNSNSPTDRRQYADTVRALRDTGAFSMLDGGFSRDGYSLTLVSINTTNPYVISLGVINAATLFTFPFPYVFGQSLQGTVYKDGRPLKSYRYSREGWSVFTWYVPVPYVEAKRQMLDQLLVDIEKDKVIPYK
jgi:hypothetical protein